MVSLINEIILPIYQLTRDSLCREDAREEAQKLAAGLTKVSMITACYFALHRFPNSRVFFAVVVWPAAFYSPLLKDLSIAVGGVYIMKWALLSVKAALKRTSVVKGAGHLIVSLYCFYLGLGLSQIHTHEPKAEIFPERMVRKISKKTAWIFCLNRSSS